MTKSASARADELLEVKFSPELVVEMCVQIAEGKTLKEICETPGYPERATFYRWISKYPEVSHAYSLAREVSAHSLEEEALFIAKSTYDAPGTAQAVRAADLYLTQLRWSAVRRNPRVYSEHNAIKITVPIQINTTLDLGGQLPNGGTPEFPNIFTLEAQAVLPAPEGEVQIRGDEAAKKLMENPDRTPLLTAEDIPESLKKKLSTPKRPRSSPYPGGRPTKREQALRTARLEAKAKRAERLAKKKEPASDV